MRVMESECTCGLHAYLGTKKQLPAQLAGFNATSQRGDYRLGDHYYNLLADPSELRTASEIDSSWNDFYEMLSMLFRPN